VAIIDRNVVICAAQMAFAAGSKRMPSCLPWSAWCVSGNLLNISAVL